MEFHEKSLELNITHELLNLSDSWYWFLTDIPLWRYWRPRYRLPFLKFPKSTSGGFHITTEGKDDPSGKAGGGYDVRIKAGIGNHLLFIQYKKGELVKTSPDPKSEFEKAPHEHFKFKINSTSTNQHFVLRNLTKGIGGGKGNAVVYAFPLIADMNELEANAGKLIRKTKFVSIDDLDIQAIINSKPFKWGKEHSFRIGKYNMNRCEVNYYYYYYGGQDRAKDLITDIIAVSFQKTLAYFISEIENNFTKYNLSVSYISEGLQQAFGQYLRYLLHYFEVTPSALAENEQSFFNDYATYFLSDEFSEYKNATRDVEIIISTFKALSPFGEFISKPINTKGDIDKIFSRDIPQYEPTFLIPSFGDNGLLLRFEEGDARTVIEDLTYLVF